MSQPRVLVLSEEIYPADVEVLKTRYNVTVIHASSISEKEVLKALPGQNAIFLSSYHFVDKEILDIAGPELKIVSTMSMGYDHLNLPEIKGRGIKVGHTLNVVTEAVAEIAVMLTLSAARRTHEGRELITQNKWDLTKRMLGCDLRGSTVGIVGLGNIGQATVKRLKPFGIARFIYTDVAQQQAGDVLGAVFVSLPDLLKESDFIIVATPLNQSTVDMFNDDAFAQMKKTAVLVNVGRGPVVNTDAVVRALRNDTIFAAGLDVMTPEPLPIDHPLLSLPNAIITPHLGSSTVQTRSDMSRIATQNIINALDGKPLLYEL